MNSFKKRIALKEWILAAIFAAITAIMAQIIIQIPFSEVPITLQTLAVFLSAAVLGSRGAFLSQLTYILIGAAGLPVFAGLKGGIHVLIGYSGGYIWSFPVAAFLTGFILERKNNPSRIYMMIAMAVGLIVCYTLGTLQLAFILNLTLTKALLAGVVPYIPLDLIKLTVASLIGYEVRKALIRANLIKA